MEHRVFSGYSWGVNPQIHTGSQLGKYKTPALECATYTTQKAGVEHHRAESIQTPKGRFRWGHSVGRDFRRFRGGHFLFSQFLLLGLGLVVTRSKGVGARVLLRAEAVRPSALPGCLGVPWRQPR